MQRRRFLLGAVVAAVSSCVPLRPVVMAQPPSEPSPPEEAVWFIKGDEVWTMRDRAEFKKLWKVFWPDAQLCFEAMNKLVAA